MATRDEAVRTLLVASVAALIGIGAIMIYSTTTRGDGPLVAPSFMKQMFYMVVGVAAAFAVGCVDYHVLLKHSRLLLGAAAALLALVLLIGSPINGACRWLRIGPLGLGFQPSEFAKLSLVVFLAAFLAARRDAVASLRKTLLPAAGAVALVCMLILPEPDIGTTALVAAVSWVILFIAGAKLLYLLAPLPPAAAVLAYKIATSPYAWARIEAWLNPWKHARESGYHIIQSLIAVGSGGVWGVGLGASRQKLHFLPEASTDFIFAILAEELGLVGVTVVLFLYTVFIAVGLAIARRAADAGGMLLALGITSMIALQTIINIGVVTQVLPTKGIPLPFISSGGSATIFMLIGVGILYNVAKRSAAAPALERGPVEVE